MLAYILAIMMHLAPHQNRIQLMPQARAIAAVAQNDEEATILTVISLYETSFHPERRPGRIVPFGLSCCYHYCAPMEHWALRALMIMDNSLKQCGRNYDLRFGFFHSGACTTDPYASREAAATRRLLRRYSRNFHGRLRPVLVHPIAQE